MRLWGLDVKIILKLLLLIEDMSHIFIFIFMFGLFMCF